MAVAIAVAVLGLGAAAQAAYIPVDFTGFNQDIVAKYDAAAPLYDATCDVNGAGAWVWGESGAPGFGEAGKTGLPYSGPNSNPQTITSAYNSSTTFTLQSYAANNTAMATAAAGSTLTLATPARYNGLAILSSGGYDATAWQATLHFSDSSATILDSASDPAFSVVGANAAIGGIGYVYDAAWDTLPVQSGGALNEHDFALSSADRLKTLTSITFTTSGVTNFYAVSGQVPEPTSSVLLLTGIAGLIAYAWRKCR
jgi:hypothetical protein